MVRRSMTVLAVIGCLILSGCSAIPLPLPFLPQRAPVAQVPAVGTCLADMNGYDSDRRSIVACTELHLYDVVGSAEWPGMAGAIEEEGGARKVFDLIIGQDTGSMVANYWEWATEFCSTALRDTIGWSTTVTDDLWVMPAGAYGVDLSLASRADFLAGDHVTLCSAIWWESLAYDSEITIESMLESEFPLETRDCWVETELSLEFAYCDQPHTDQSVLTFDGQAAFGIDFIKDPEAMSDDDWMTVSDRCWELTRLLLPDFDSDTMYTWAAPSEGPAWDELASGTPDPGQSYFYSCGIAMHDGSSFTGDIFGGSIEPAVGGTTV